MLLCFQSQVHYRKKFSQNLLLQGQRFGCENKPMDLWACEIEEHEHGLARGAGANTTLLSVTL
jgi:hypothetical protein